MPNFWKRLNSPGGKKFSIALLSGVKRIYIILNPIKVLLSSFVTRFGVFWTDVPWCWWLLMNFDDCSIVFYEFWWFFNDFWRFLDVFSESARWLWHAEIKWIFMNFHDFLIFSWFFHEFSWIFMIFHDFSWFFHEKSKIFKKSKIFLKLNCVLIAFL